MEVEKQANSSDSSGQTQSCDQNKLVGPPRCDGQFDEIPLEIQYNDFLRSGYRLNHIGFWPILGSCFKWHNETVNVWTHFLGKLAAIACAIMLMTMYPNMHGPASAALARLHSAQQLNESFDLPDYVNGTFDEMHRDL